MTSANRVNQIWAVVPAAGVGARMQSDRPKQYLPLLDETVIEKTLKRLLDIPAIDAIVLALHPDDTLWATTSLVNHPRIHLVCGGGERRDSVLQAIDFCAKELSSGSLRGWVLVHDAARPCVSVAKIEALIDCACAAQPNANTGAILASPASDTIKRVAESGIIEGTEDRSLLWMAHTPQLFPIDVLQPAMKHCIDENMPITDEASAVEHYGGKVRVVLDRRDNIKITVPEDLPWAESILRQQENFSCE